MGYHRQTSKIPSVLSDDDRLRRAHRIGDHQVTDYLGCPLCHPAAPAVSTSHVDADLPQASTALPSERWVGTIGPHSEPYGAFGYLDSAVSGYLYGKRTVEDLASALSRARTQIEGRHDVLPG